MTNVILTEHGIIEGTGVPSYFLKDHDFEAVLKHPEAAKQLYGQFGQCCIGRLGVPGKDGIYREQKFHFSPDAGERGELSYYEKI